MTCSTPGGPVRADSYTREVVDHLKSMVFEDHFGGGDRRQAMQVLELFLHLAVPGGLGVKAEIAEGGFHIGSSMVCDCGCLRLAPISPGSVCLARSSNSSSSAFSSPDISSASSSTVRPVSCASLAILAARS